MQLQRLTVTNHSRLADVEVEVRKHLVLVGANDVGKSSLLRCMDLLLGASTAQLYARVTAEDVDDTSLPMVLEATLVDLTDDESAHFPDAIIVDPLGVEPMKLVVRLEVDASDAENLSMRRTTPGDGSTRQVSREQLGVIGWRMVGAAQASARDLRQNGSSAIDDILAKIDLGADTSRLEELAKEFQSALTGSGVLSALRDKLATQLSKATPKPVAAGDLSFSTGAAAEDDLLSDVRLQLVRDGHPHDLTEQSDGARALFALALYDLVAESANIVAVDEPEIHLHPTSQRSLARLLRDGTNQKIMATHSADIVGLFDPEQVVVVRPGGVVVQPEVGFLATEQKSLAQWWVQNKLEPLTARRILGLEGPSDRIVVTRVAELMGVDLDRAGVSVLELLGAGSVGSVLKLFGDDGFRVPFTLLIDEDARRATAKTLGVESADVEHAAPYPVFVSDKELEDEYIRALGPDELFAQMQNSGLWRHGQFAPIRATGPTHTAMLKFCKDHKVLSAIVVSTMLTETTARGIDSVSRLIEAIAADA